MIDYTEFDAAILDSIRNSGPSGMTSFGVANTAFIAQHRLAQRLSSRLQSLSRRGLIAFDGRAWRIKT